MRYATLKLKDYAIFLKQNSYQFIILCDFLQQYDLFVKFASAHAREPDRR